MSSFSMLTTTCFSRGVRKLAVSGYYDGVEKNVGNNDSQTNIIHHEVRDGCYRNSR